MRGTTANDTPWLHKLSGGMKHWPGFFCAHFLPRLRSWLLPSQPFLCPWMRVSTVKKRNWHWTCRHRASRKKSWQWRPWSSSVRDNSSQLSVWQQNMLRLVWRIRYYSNTIRCIFKIAYRYILRMEFCICHAFLLLIFDCRIITNFSGSLFVLEPPREIPIIKASQRSHRHFLITKSIKDYSA